MLRGAIKEAGVLVLLNRYYERHVGSAPLGKDFNVRQAPREERALLQSVVENFDPQHMPVLVGVGDTVTSQVVEVGGKREVRRGGSDRNFLQLIQAIGWKYAGRMPIGDHCGNVVAYVDSSGGEVKNRKPLQLNIAGTQVLEGPGDPRDTDDPLALNVVFPGGPKEYVGFFCRAAAMRRQNFS